MAIRNRVVVMNKLAVTTAGQTDAAFVQVTMPKAGKLKYLGVNATSCAGTAARTFICYKAGSAGAAIASATTAMTPAVALADTPLPVLTPALGDGSANFVDGETLYVKYTTGSGTTSTDTWITLVFDY